METSVPHDWLDAFEMLISYLDSLNGIERKVIFLNEIDAWRRVMEWMDDWYEQGLIDYEYYLEQRKDALDNYIEAERDAWYA